MEVTVLVLPAMEVTDLDTVSGRDLPMLILKLGEPLDTDTVPDTVLVDMEVTVLALPATEVATVDTEDTDTVDIDTESNFYISNNELPFILISSHHTYLNQTLFHSKKQNQILFRHVSSKVEEEFLKRQKRK